MGYSLSERAFNRVAIYLQELAESDQDTFTWEVTSSRDFAYRLRQGMKSAEKFGYINYAGLLDKYIIKEVGNKVIAEKRTVNTVTPVGIHKKAFPEVSNLSGLITVAIANNHLNVLHFPDVNLSDEDKVALSKFCKAKNWVYSLTLNELQKCQVMEQKSESPTS